MDQMKKILPDEAYELYPGQLVALTGKDRETVYAHANTFEELKPLVDGLDVKDYVVMRVPTVTVQR